MDTKTVSIKGQEIIAAVLYQNGPEHWTVYCAIRPQVRTDDMAGKPIFYFFVEAPGYDAPACLGTARLAPAIAFWHNWRTTCLAYAPAN